MALEMSSGMETKEVLRNMLKESLNCLKYIFSSRNLGFRDAASKG